MHGRLAWACAAASVGFLYHSPATIPFWILFAVVLVKERRWKAMFPLAGAMVLLAIAFTAQRSQVRPQGFLTVIDPEWEQVIRMRTAYDWIDLWPAGSVLAFVLACAVAAAAACRIRALTSFSQRVFLIGFPVLGVLSIAVSALLLDHWKWALMAQVQPARATLFTIVFAQINCALAGLVAARERRWWEAFPWFVAVLLPPVNPMLMGPFTLAQVVTIGVLASVALSVERIKWTAAFAVALIGCWAIPNYAKTLNYPSLHSAELDQLNQWARANTPAAAMFVFPVSARNLEQGVFRANAKRALYTDWKAGGQVNYFRDFALEWRKRWQELSSGKLTVDEWRARGVDYLIYAGPKAEQLAQPPVFENSRYRAYEIAGNRKAP
jgi:hypothetical protein